MTRLHPFRHVFSRLAETRFPAIRDEVAEPDMDVTTMARLSATQELLREFGLSERSDQDPRAVNEYLASLFVAYRFWRAGERTFSVDGSTLDESIADPPVTEPRVPHGACYVELPKHRFWATIGEDRPHEPADGLFVVDTRSHSELTVLAILGLRPERDGFSQITVSGNVSDVLAAASTMRDPPFAPVMDGGTAAGFRSVTSEGELLHLAHLALDSVTE